MRCAVVTAGVADPDGVAGAMASDALASRALAVRECDPVAQADVPVADARVAATAAVITINR